MDLDKIIEEFGKRGIIAGDIADHLEEIRDKLGEKAAKYCARKVKEYVEEDKSAALTFMIAANSMEKKSDIHVVAKFFDYNIYNLDNKDVECLDNITKRPLDFYKMVNRSMNPISLAHIIEKQKEYLSKVSPRDEMIDFLLSLDKKTFKDVDRLIYNCASVARLCGVLDKYKEKPYFDDVIKVLDDMSHHFINDTHTGFYEVFERYYDVGEHLVASLRSCGMGELKYEAFIQLNNDIVHETVKNAKDPRKMINRVMSSNYGAAVDLLYCDVSPASMAIAQKTFNKIQKLHEGRGYDVPLAEGFYGELNRALRENPNPDRTVKQYCNEVMNKIEERIDELLVVTNA